MTLSKQHTETPRLGGLTPEAFQRGCPAARAQSLPARETLYRQGGRQDEVWHVLSGQITLSRVSPGGAAFTTALLGPGSWFGQALGGAERAEETATAKSAVRVWRADARGFRRLLAEHPAAALELIDTQAAQLRQMGRKLEAFAFKPVEARLAETIRELSGGFATRCEHGFGEHLRLTQQELADLVGASRPVVSTILNRLRRTGVLNYNREYICVRQFDEVARLIEES